MKLNGVWLTDKTYEIISETEIQVKVSDGTFDQSALYSITQKSCSEITISYEGLEVTMFSV